MRRSYGAQALRRNDSERRAMVKHQRAEMRKSPVWMRCFAALQSLCLLSGHARPVSTPQAWMLQPVVMPGDPAASTAAQATDIAANF